jgi:hypothetical protein
VGEATYVLLRSPDLVLLTVTAVGFRSRSARSSSRAVFDTGFPRLQLNKWIRSEPERYSRLRFSPWAPEGWRTTGH